MGKSGSGKSGGSSKANMTPKAAARIQSAGDRHPKIRHGVLIGAGAKILGNIEIGHCARIAAGSVVLKSVPHNTTVAGVPARVIGEAGCPEPSRAMDHLFEDEDG